jgi:hypothetical protein
MQLGEPVGIAVVLDQESECPLEHKKEPVKPADNALVGVGETLGRKMERGSSTITRPEFRSAEPGKAQCPDHGPEPVSVESETYPVTLAAHHLIPAQESLKEHKILQYIEKEKGALEENLGYDVNGAENGVWLPGPYAIEGWGDMTLEVEDLPTSTKRKAIADKRRAALPAKTQGLKFQGNYAIAAQLEFNAQFHDRHVDYSKFVSRQLEKIYLLFRLNQAYRCAQCKKNTEKIAPPRSLIARLNTLSGRLRTYLIGNPVAWRSPVFTSAWSEYMTVFSVRKQG